MDLGKQIRPNFLRSTSFKKSCQQIWCCVNLQPFILFIHDIWGDIWGTFPASPIRQAGSHLWQAPNLWSTVWMNINRVTLEHNKELSKLIFLFKSCVILKSFWYARYFEYSCNWCSWTTEKKEFLSKICVTAFTVLTRALLIFPK